jgi:2'-5' RNA ligase
MAIVRAFIAIDLDPTIREIWERSLSSLRRSLPSLRWVAAEHLHLTLRFLGAIDGRVAGRIGAELADVARTRSAWRLRLGGLGFFGPSRSPRVVWLGVVSGCEELEAVQREVEAIARRHGAPAESGVWHPHVTLARARRDGKRQRAGDVERVCSGEFARLFEELGRCETRVEAMTLYSSELRPGGPRYEPIGQGQFRDF